MKWLFLFSSCDNVLDSSNQVMYEWPGIQSFTELNNSTCKQKIRNICEIKFYNYQN